MPSEEGITEVGCCIHEQFLTALVLRIEQGCPDAVEWHATLLRVRVSSHSQLVVWKISAHKNVRRTRRS